MHRSIAVIIALVTATLATATARAQLAAPPDIIAIENVNVIPMDRERVIPGQTVVVRARRIAAMGPTGTVDVPADAIRVDGSGRYLLPGLAEMHGHVPSAAWPDSMVDRYMHLNIAAGITTVRSMLGHPVQLRWREEIARGERLGPRLFLAGPSINGNSVPTVDAAWRAVTEQRAAGYDLLKIHPGLTLENFLEVASTAHREGIPFGGHIPNAVGVEAALEAGIASIEHLDGYFTALLPEGSTAQQEFFPLNVIDQVDESRIPMIVEATAEAGTWIVPTHTLFVTGMGTQSVTEMLARPEMSYWPATFGNGGGVDQWAVAVEQWRSGSTADRQGAERVLAIRDRLIREMHRAGVGILLGADAPQIMNVPGFATLNELELMVEAGLSNFAALEAGTVNPARFFGLEDSFGTIAAGKRADLLLLDANPLEDVSNVRDPAGVVVAGHWIPRNEIRRILSRFSR